MPLSLNLSQVVPILGQLISVQIGGCYYLDKPEGGPDWGLRLGITLLFPK